MKNKGSYVQVFFFQGSVKSKVALYLLEYVEYIISVTVTYYYQLNKPEFEKNDIIVVCLF